MRFSYLSRADLETWGEHRGGHGGGQGLGTMMGTQLQSAVGGAGLSGLTVLCGEFGRRAGNFLYFIPPVTIGARSNNQLGMGGVRIGDGRGTVRERNHLSFSAPEQ